MGDADIVLGSRWLGLDPAKAGMPWWKRLWQPVSDRRENRVLGLHLSEYHTGYRAYSRRFLEAIPFLENSNDFVFDNAGTIQAATFGSRLERCLRSQVPRRASSTSFLTVNGLRIGDVVGARSILMHRAGFPSPWLTPSSDADKQALAIGEVATTAMFSSSAPT